MKKIYNEKIRKFFVENRQNDFVYLKAVCREALLLFTLILEMFYIIYCSLIHICKILYFLSEHSAKKINRKIMNCP